MGVRSVYTSVRKYVSYSTKELEALLTIGLIFGFVISFQDWGVDSFDYVAGAGNLLQSFLVVFVSLGASWLLQKSFAAVRGLKWEHVLWTRGLIASLLLGLFSNGFLLVTLSSSFKLQRVRTLGGGRGVGVHHLAKCAAVGLLTHAALAALAKVVLDLTGAYVAQQAIIFNLAYMAWNVLPLPQIVGSMIFFWSRVYYVFGFFAVLGFVLLGFLGYPSFILAVAAGAIAAFVFFEKYESGWA